MRKNKKGTKITCKCGYAWVTRSTRPYVSCPYCMGKVRNTKIPLAYPKKRASKIKKK